MGNRQYMLEDHDYEDVVKTEKDKAQFEMIKSLPKDKRIIFAREQEERVQAYYKINELLYKSPMYRNEGQSFYHYYLIRHGE